jgi:Domain of unknown function (DUF2017)
VTFRNDRRVRRARGGGFELRLPPEERGLLRELPEQMREVSESDDPALARLYPSAYPDDEEHEAQFREMVRDDLRRQRRDAQAVMERTLDADRLSEEELLAWVATINDARLVLGTRLDVDEELDISRVDPRDPRAPTYAAYAYLTWLEEQAIEALSSE